MVTEPVPRHRPLWAFCHRDGHGAGSPSPTPRGPPCPAGQAACSAAPRVTGLRWPRRLLLDQCGLAAPPSRARGPGGNWGHRGVSRSDEAQREHPSRPLSGSPPVSHRTRPSPGLQTHGLPQPRFRSRGAAGEPEAGPRASGASATWSLGPPLGPVGSECRTARLPVGRCPWSSQEVAPTPRPECQLSEGRPRHGGGCSWPRGQHIASPVSHLQGKSSHSKKAAPSHGVTARHTAAAGRVTETRRQHAQAP